MKGRWVVPVVIAFVIAALFSSGAVFAQTQINRGNYVPGGGDFPFGHPAFQQLWSRIDLVFRNNKAQRAWFWGPGPDSAILWEPYADPNTARDGNRRRVQYFDKSRMEINSPGSDTSNAFQYVSNGLLSVELISGDMQVGTDSYIRGNDGCIAMTGDTTDDTLAPTYFAFRGVSNTRAGDHNVLDATNQKPTLTIDHNGNVGNDLTKRLIPLTEFVHYENKHNIPRVFWDFLHTSGPVYLDNGQLANQQLVNPWFYASGLPISEPYWAHAIIRGRNTEVMIQAYERVILTYTPSNTQGWQVEMSNIGQHYFNWRYSTFGLCPGARPVRPQSLVLAPVVVGVSTPVPTVPPTPTFTPQSSVGPTHTRTPTRVPTNTVVRTNTPTTPHTATPAATTQPPTLAPTFTEVERSTPPPARPTATDTLAEPQQPTDTPTLILMKTKTPTHTPIPH